MFLLLSPVPDFPVFLLPDLLQLVLLVVLFQLVLIPVLLLIPVCLVLESWLFLDLSHGNRNSVALLSLNLFTLKLKMKLNAPDMTRLL